MKLFLLGTDHRRSVLSAIVVITLLFAAGLPGLKIDTGLDSLIPANDPDRLVYQRILEEFGADNRTVIYIRDPDLWSVEKLARLERLHQAVVNLDGVDRVDSLFNLRTLAHQGDSIISVPIIIELPSTGDQARAVRDTALANPIYTGSYFSSDGNVIAMSVSATNSSNSGRELYERIQTLLDEEQPRFERIFQAGPARLDAGMMENLYKDITVTGPLSAVVLVLMIMFVLRNGVAAFIPLLTTAITLIWTLGMLAWSGIPVNILTVIMPSLIIVISSLAGIHIIQAYSGGRHDPVASSPAGVGQALQQAGLPLLLAILTTTLGFASNLFSNIGLIRNFAITSSFAILVSGLISILLVPMLLSAFAGYGRDSEQARRRHGGPPAVIIDSLRHLRDRYPRTILGLTGLISVFFIYQASTLYVSNEPLSYFFADEPIVRDSNRIHEDLSGINRFFITLESNTEKAFLEPRNLEKLAEIQAFLQKQDVYDKSLSLADYLGYVSRTLQGTQPGNSLPGTRQLIAQYLLFFHRSELESYISHDYSRANIVVRHNINDSRVLIDHINELEEVVNHIAGAGLIAHIAGGNLLVNQAADGLLAAQVRALLILFALVFLMISVLFTSMKAGALALIPALIPVILLSGIMGLLGIPLNPGTVMVAVIAVGIAVDGTIHLLSRYNDLCRRTSDYPGAVHAAVREEAMPLITSCLALSFGFGVLLFSNFTVVAQFGALAAATVIFSIFANLLLTPLLMTRIRLVGLYQILSMTVDDEAFDNCLLFRGMTDYQRRKAILISELHEFKQAELLIEQDTSGRSMYLILTGRAEVLRREGDQTHRLAVLGPGQVFGEIGYVRETRRTADVRAMNDMTALKFDYERLQKDLRYFPGIVAKLNFNISCILGERLADMVEQSRS